MKNQEVRTKARHCDGIGLRNTHVYGLADNGWTRSSLLEHSLPPTHTFFLSSSLTSQTTGSLQVHIITGRKAEIAGATESPWG